MPTVLLVRHGQASFDSDDYDRLSPLGARQAAHLGDWFGRCARPVHALHRGALLRHRQTAEHFLEALPPPLRPQAEVRVDPGFDEYDHDAILLALRPDFADKSAMRAWTSQQPQPRRAFQALFAEAMQRWMAGAHDDYPETWAAFQSRCLAALQRSIAAAPEAKSLVIVSSGGPISAICQALLGLSDERTGELCYGLVNSGVTRLLHGAGRISLHALNDIAHLEVQGDPGLVTYR